MNDPPTFSTTCPHCNKAVDVPYEYAEIDIECPHCQGTFFAQSLQSVDSTIAIPPPLPIESEESLLTAIEDLLRKMIIGIPRFVFIEVPRTLWTLFCDTFPTLVKLIRISVLFLAWVVLAFWPAFVSPSYRYLIPLPSKLFQIIPEINIWWADYILWVWVPLALIGSVWGMFKVVLRKRQRRRDRLQKERSKAEPVSDGNAEKPPGVEQTP